MAPATRGGRAAAVILSGLILAPATAAAADRCERPLGHMASIEGDVDMVPGGESLGVPVHLGQALCPGDVVRTGARSRAAVRFTNDGTFRLDQNTTLVVHAPAEPERSSVEVLRGLINFFSPRRRSLTVTTAFLNGGVEGTEFAVRVDADEAEIILFAGEVVADNPLGRVEMAPGEAVTATRGGPPVRRLVARPRDAVAWALHYPPVLSVPADGTATSAMALPGPLIEAYAVGGRGDVAGAFAALDRVPEKDRSAAFHVYRAALLLDVGRVDEARADIDRALVLDDGAAAAWSLKTIIAVAGNDREGALADSERAVAADPRSATARIARSYALQADFRLEDARDELQRAVADNPENALAWARLAEMWLALGHRRRSREAADRAAALAPNDAVVQTVRGFAALSQFAVSGAASTFAQAIALDSSAPLPRLGLGLATINSGDLAAGRGDLETAVALDPGNALLRSYLGKAYFEEKRDDLAAREFAIAKDLDPNDPTPFLYDAIRLQTENRPVEALWQLQRSVELNDNRAVFRGRLLLDEDLAVQGASQARIYDNLGFEQLGIREATRSLTLDPGNSAAHRFLADLYRSRPRTEIARVSEVLQSQMLQPININPVPPSLAQTDLNALTLVGPRFPGLNEYTPLFLRNQAQLQATGAAGNQETVTGEIIASAVYDRVSISAGQYHYQTAGFRENNDNRQDLTNVYLQAAVTSDVNLQFEYRRRTGRFGDLALDFDSAVFLPTLRREVDANSVRLGITTYLTPNDTFVLVGTHAENRRRESETLLTDPFLDEFSSDINENGNQLEGQYISRYNAIDGLVGFTVYDSDISDTYDRRFVVPFAPPFPLVLQATESAQFNQTQKSGYAYVNINVPYPVVWTVGFSVDDFHRLDRDISRVNPKLGVQWSVTRDIVLRGGFFDVFRPALANNQTLQPTQVAGFNQFYDDFVSTESRVFAGGLDVRFTRDLQWGVEGYHRDVNSPLFAIRGRGNVVGGPMGVVIIDPPTLDQKADEALIRAYVNWTPGPLWALRAEVVLDKYKFQSGTSTNIPRRLETISLPFSARYFHPSGLFAGVGLTVVHQDLDSLPNSGFPEGQDTVPLVDAVIGFRMPKRLGFVSFEVRNLFNETFQYQDDSFRSFDRLIPAISPYIPERAFLGRLTLIL